MKLHVDFLKEHLGKLKRHDKGHVNELLPFISTKDIKLESFSNSIIGSFTRHTSGFSELKLKKMMIYSKKTSFLISFYR